MSRTYRKNREIAKKGSGNKYQSYSPTNSFKYLWKWKNKNRWDKIRSYKILREIIAKKCANNRKLQESTV